MLYPNIWVVYITQKKSEMMRDGYKILRSISDTIRFQKKVWEKARHSANYQTLSLHAFMSWVYFLSSETGPKSCFEPYEPRSDYYLAVPDWDRKELEESIVRCTPMTTILLAT